MGNQLSLRERLAKGGIHNRKFTPLSPSRLAEIPRDISKRSNVYEAKAVVSCLDQSERMQPYILARENRGYRDLKAGENWFYISLEKALPHNEVNFELPSSEIEFNIQPMPIDFLNRPVNELYLITKEASFGAKINRLVQYLDSERQLESIGDLLQYSRQDICQLRNLGTQTINRIVAYLGQFGLGLRGE